MHCPNRIIIKKKKSISNEQFEVKKCQNKNPNTFLRDGREREGTALKWPFSFHITIHKSN